MERWRSRSWGRLVVALPLCVGLVAVAAGCGSDDDSGTSDSSAGNRAKQIAESTGARALGEALRVILLADNAFDEHPRDIRVLQENVNDLPGNPKVTGIEDKDGDGKDDDGNLEAHVYDEVACVSVSTHGRVDVHGGHC
jgi:hypothetical protein